MRIYEKETERLREPFGRAGFDDARLLFPMTSTAIAYAHDFGPQPTSQLAVIIINFVLRFVSY